MNINKKQTKGFIASLLVGILILGALMPAAQAGELDRIQGSDKGPSYTNVVPIEKVTFVNFDEETIIDDYAYLASVPTAVFKDEENRLFSHPLLFYQDKLDYDDEKYRILDTYPGISYFMEDWMSFCNGKLDEMTTINLDQSKVSQWGAENLFEIESENPYEIAGDLALHDWSYSKDAVVAVIDEEFESPEIEHEGIAKGVIPSGYNLKEITFQMDKPEIGVGGNYEGFEIDAPYKYVVANMYWENVAIDLDLQLYDNQLGMADADSKWNIFYGAGETASSYVYNYGTWEVGVTYMPTQTMPDEGIMESNFDTVDDKEEGLFKEMGLFGGSNKQDVVISLYPGIEVDIDDEVPYGCRDVELTLEWDNPNVPLGFVVLDTLGAETASTPSNEEIVEGVETGITERTITLERLGETNPDDKYKVCVFALDDVKSDLDFTVKYSWKQNYTRERGDMLASATEGSVLASTLNAPLLYASKEKLPEVTSDVLYKLGVENICLVDLGGYGSEELENELDYIGDVTVFDEYKEVYDEIKKHTESQDIVFSTVDPWTYYYSKDAVPVGEYPGALFIGPAAYIAAHHGAPVVLVDNHPELSQSMVWHTEFWRNTANDVFRPNLPSVSCMVLTGRNVVNFLEEIGFDLPLNKEELATMITVADQFDIGTTWDRTFTGRAIPGRFCSSPVDIAYWSSRNIFYPSLIFENPALQGTVKLVNGSTSKVVPLVGKILAPRGTDLRITRYPEEVEYTYPVLHTYNVYLYKFNEIAQRHWGGQYTTANGKTPYEDPSPLGEGSIDVGAVPGKVGAYVADIHETYCVPFYADKAGFDSCFSTNYEYAIDNLNKGVIMWMESCHGGNGNYGNLGFWNPESPYVYEENPWRAYERPLISAGTLKEFIQYLPELARMDGLTGIAKLASLVAIPLDIFAIDHGSTEDPDVAVMNPQVPLFTFVDAFHVDLRIKESKGLSLIPLLGRLFRVYGDDGVVIDPLAGGENVLAGKNGINFDEDLDNLHSMGLNAVSCLVAHTYFHQTMIRHGTTYQILDPWSTSWYSGIWLHNIPRALALGKTIGQAYEEGMAEVGVQYLVDQWWWDLNENVIFFGDPDLRVFTPSTEFDLEGNNYWERSEVQALSYDASTDIDGHMPYGAVDYPKQKQPEPMIPLWLLAIIVLIILLVIVLAATSRKRKK